VVGKHHVCGFSRGSPVSSNFLHSTNSSRLEPKLSLKIPVRWKWFRSFKIVWFWVTDENISQTYNHSL